MDGLAGKGAQFKCMHATRQQPSEAVCPFNQLTTHPGDSTHTHPLP